MIACKFCGGKSETSFLFLNCKHLACIPCAFLRTDFTSQQIECCQSLTQIDARAMERIITSKRMNQNFKQNNHNLYSHNRYSNLNEEASIYSKKTQVDSNQSMQVSSHQAQPQTMVTNYQEKQVHKDKRNVKQRDSVEVDNLLIAHMQECKREYEFQRSKLNSKQQSVIKDLVLTYEEEVKRIQKPTLQAKIDKFSTDFLKREFVISRKPNDQQQFVELSREQKCKQSYEYILKRLEINQQRMKQKLQGHVHPIC